MSEPCTPVSLYAGKTRFGIKGAVRKTARTYELNHTTDDYTTIRQALGVSADAKFFEGMFSPVGTVLPSPNAVALEPGTCTDLGQFPLVCVVDAELVEGLPRSPRSPFPTIKSPSLLSSPIARTNDGSPETNLEKSAEVSPLTPLPLSTLQWEQTTPSTTYGITYAARLERRMRTVARPQQCTTSTTPPSSHSGDELNECTEETGLLTAGTDRTRYSYGLTASDRESPVSNSSSMMFPTAKSKGGKRSCWSSIGCCGLFSWSEGKRYVPV